VKLRRLSPEAGVLVTRELASGELQRHEQTTYDRFLDEATVSIELAQVDDVIDKIIEETKPHDSSIDRIAAPLIHAALPMPRREAANPGVWRYLAVAHRPDFVRHRWEAKSWATMRTRFWSPGTRHDSNAFSRLWWIAELTRDGTNYELTERVFSRQPLATQLFVRGFSESRAAVAAFVDEMETAVAADVERVAKELHGALGVLVLEGLDISSLRKLIRSYRQI
jgi:hypothetical protein